MELLTECSETPAVRLASGRAVVRGFAAVFFLFSAVSSVSAQERAPGRDDAAKRLKRSQTELERTRERARRIETDVDSLIAERERLNKRLVETGQNVQRLESRMTLIEGRIKKLAGERDGLRVRLSSQNRQIMRLLAAMQRMGRDPPPVIITQRSDALRMVRSAMLLAKAFPELKGQADAITAQLSSLTRVMAQHEAESQRLRAESIRLSDAKTQLAALIETKRQSLLDRQKELRELQRTSQQLSRNVTNLKDLIAKLDKAVASSTRLGKYNEKVPPAPEGEPKAAPGGVKPPAVAGRRPQEPNAIEVAPGANARVASAARLEPAVPFYEAKGTLPLPASGQRVIDFGDKTQYGAKSKGLVIKTRFDAQIVSPSDGWVVYAGEFRSYGQLLIINAGAGYHILLAGLSRIDVQLGQFVLAGEPIGSMAGAPRTGAGENTPVLYVEFRKKGQPIDPGPWWASGQQRVQG